MRALKHLAVPLLAFGLLVAALVVVVSRRPAGDAERPRATFERKTRAHLDHAAYFKEPFADGPSVTRACLSCHKDAAHQVMQTAHWSWLGDEVRRPGQAPVRVGKRNLVNNFCIGTDEAPRIQVDVDEQIERAYRQIFSTRARWIAS